MRVDIEDYGRIEASPLDVVRLVASYIGISDLDVDPGVDGKVTIRSSVAPVTGVGIDAACRKFLQIAFDKHC